MPHRVGTEVYYVDDKLRLLSNSLYLDLSNAERGLQQAEREVENHKARIRIINKQIEQVRTVRSYLDDQFGENTSHSVKAS